MRHFAWRDEDHIVIYRLTEDNRLQYCIGTAFVDSCYETVRELKKDAKHDGATVTEI